MRNPVTEPLTDAYLLECEQAARRFSGAYTGTSGSLAAMVLATSMAKQALPCLIRQPGWR